MRTPPRRQKGQKGAKPVNGRVMDLPSFALTWGMSEKKVRSEVARGVLPHRRVRGRILFLEEEMLDFYRRLPGVTASEALENLAARTQTPLLRRIKP